MKIEELKDIKDIKIKKYVEILLKKNMIFSIIDNIVYEDDNGILNYDCATKEVFKVIGGISLYTDIELLDNDYDNYDALCSNGLLDEILEHIGGDYNYYESIFEEYLSKKMEQNSIENIIAKRTNKLVNAAESTMKHIDDLLDRGDINEVSNNVLKLLTPIVGKLKDLDVKDVVKIMKTIKG